MSGAIVFIPLVAWSILAALGVLLLGLTLAAYLWGLRGWMLRFSGGAVILLMLAGPQYQELEREALSDIVLMLEDETASQHLKDRAQQTQEAANNLAAQIGALQNVELHRIKVNDSPENEGTQLMGAISQALAQLPAERVAGVVVVSDGQIHDKDLDVALSAPLHLIQTGRKSDWDRKLSIRNAPAFGILGQSFEMSLRVEDLGDFDKEQTHAWLDVSINSRNSQRIRVPIGAQLRFPLTLEQAGVNVISVSTPQMDGELSEKNNTALVQINGVRDRLRVLLVSGQPHAGGRTWRNLLKSDGAVDLVHFTIMRPMGKVDPAPKEEVSLIAFPTYELFMEKINDFDLIIFDRYKMRGILPKEYLDNVVKYVQEGGAVLVAAGPDFASAESIYYSPLGQIMPARPNGRVMEQAFEPKLNDFGRRHPVTADLPIAQSWGRWLRQIGVEHNSGHVVMEGIEANPLLILDRVDEGRVALLASDHAWLWTRGYEGGGPQLELLRRLSHWMMKEPELEEEALSLRAIGTKIHITRRSMEDSSSEVTVTSPDGTEQTISLVQNGPGVFEGEFQGSEMGVFHFVSGEQEALIGLGPQAPLEFENTLATRQNIAPIVDAFQGGVVLVEEGLPEVRLVRMGRIAAGNGWIGLTPREAFVVHNITLVRLLPLWMVLFFVGGMWIFAWLREGQR